MTKCLSTAFAGVLLALSFPDANAALPQTWYGDTPVNQTLTAVMFAQGEWVVVGGNCVAMKSTNGFNWAIRGGASGDSFTSAAYGNGIYLAGARLLDISSDGLNWTNVWSTIGSQRIFGLTFGNSQFVGVGYTASQIPALIFSSADGIHRSYPPRYGTTNTLFGVTFANGLFVAVGNRGTILTSPDADTWTSCNSGTLKPLRAITFTGSRFIAGGDGGTVVTSTDGLSWSPGAPTAFDIKGLASGNGAVVAVGNYQSDGRLHASTDGLGWPGNPTAIPEPLNAISYANGRFLAVGNNGLVVRSEVIVTYDPTNIWTKAESGSWHEELYWSLRELPSVNHFAIEFTNSGSKALAIDHATTLNYPASLHIRHLNVDAPADSFNTLLLNYAGLSTPLQLDDSLQIGPGGGLVNYGSALKTPYAIIFGHATFAEGAEGQFSLLDIDQLGAELTISNAVLSSRDLNIAGTLSQYGGSNLVGRLSLWSGGDYHLSNGTLIVTNGALIGGQDTEPRFTAAGGLVNITGGIQLGNPSFPLGSFIVRGGSVVSDSLSADFGAFTQSGGATSVRNFYVGGSTTDPTATLSGGTLSTEQFSVAYFGHFVQSGGIHVSTNMTVLGDRETAGAPGLYSLTGGKLVTPSLALRGTFEQSGGTNSVGLVSVTENRYGLNNGLLEMDDAFVGVTENWSAYPAAYIDQYGGSSVIRNSLTLSNWGYYELYGGSLSLRDIDVGIYSALYLLDSTGLSQSGLFTLSGGSLIPAYGNNQLGQLKLAGGSSRVTMQWNVVSTVRFRDSHQIPWADNAALVIENFQGNFHHLYVGTNSTGLTPSQLAKIVFDDPLGFTPGRYSATILPGGELVPTAHLLGYTRTDTALTLSWDSSRFQLFSATNVTGPYQPLNPDSSSPYTLTPTDRQRFFELRPR